jgi:hypothetical protein
MARIRADEGIEVDRVGGWTVHRRPGVSLEAVLEALCAPGEILKESRKACTRRVGDWVVKESRWSAVEALKRTALRSRYRRAWTGGNYLARLGIGVPAPHAFVEKGRGRIILGNALICEYLNNCLTVEQSAARLVQEGADSAFGGAAASFLSGLAGAVNALVASGAYHGDLSGKNIFTRDGISFYFIDLESVVLGRTYTDKLRLKNHVQLYDSFCDIWPDNLLRAFLAEMLPEGRDPQAWMESVRVAQKVRRARTEAIWIRQGKRRAS